MQRARGEEGREEREQEERKQERNKERRRRERNRERAAAACICLPILNRSPLQRLHHPFNHWEEDSLKARLPVMRRYIPDLPTTSLISYLSQLPLKWRSDSADRLLRLTGNRSGMC